MQNPDILINNIVSSAIKGIEDTKGEEIITLKFTAEQTSLCDYFIICQANTDRQVKAIADSIEKTVREDLKKKPATIEGYNNAQWVLLDYYDVIVHVFQKEYREFYSLEKLWADAETITN